MPIFFVIYCSWSHDGDIYENENKKVTTENRLEKSGIELVPLYGKSLSGSATEAIMFDCGSPNKFLCLSR